MCTTANDRTRGRGRTVAGTMCGSGGGAEQTTTQRRRCRRRRALGGGPCTALFLFLVLRAGGAAGAKGGSVRGTAPAEQRFAMEPQDQTAIVGSRVTLPCRVVNKSGQLQWTKDDFGLGTHRNLSGFERYAMVGSDEEGDFSLDISPVMLDDDAKYQCQVGPGRGGTPGIRSRFAQLTVLVPPEAPKIVQGDFLVTTEDREIELECVSVGGKPAAEITWIDGAGTVLSQGIEYVKEPLRDARRYTAKSILKLTPKQQHHNTTFTCQAQNTADRTYRSVRLKLEVKYAPKVRVAATGGRILEGADVRLSCHADANPRELTYRWFVGDEPSEGSHAQELLMGNVSRRLHGTVVRCEVRNAVGKSEDSTTLDVSYGPSFRERPRSVEADRDATVTLACAVDGNPPPEVLWTHGPDEQVVGRAPNLTLAVSQATAGPYRCRATVAGFPPVEADATVLLRGPPAIRSPAQQFGSVRDRAQLECDARSIPRPRQILWAFNGRELNVSEQPGDGGYRALETITPGGVHATLIVSHCRREHFGRYNCTVVNDYGADFLEIDFISQEQNLVPIIVLGSLGGLTFFVVVVTIGLCLCSRHRHRKKQLPPADVIPKYDVPGKDCDGGGGGGGASNGSRKIDRDRESTTNIALSVRPSEATAGLSTTADVIAGSPLAVLKGDAPTDCCRYSGDFSDSLSHLQHSSSKVQPQQQQKTARAAGASGNGYVPYVSYSRDYSPPSTHHLMQFEQTPSGTMTLARKRTAGQEAVRPSDVTLPSIQSSVSSIPNGLLSHPIVGCHIGLDMRMSGANYGTLRGSRAGGAGSGGAGMGLLPLQLPLPPPATANPTATPAPPPYSAPRTHPGLLELGLAGSTASNGAGTAPISSGSPASSSQSGSLSLASSQPSQGATGGVPATQQQPQGSPAADQFILPSSSSSAKPVMLATHV